MAVEPAYVRPPEPTPAVMSDTIRQSRLDSDTLDTLAWTMLGEAANQGTTGMAAIAHVILNRAESGRYPSDPKSVALQNKQFSTWNEGQGGNDPKNRFPKSSPAFKQARKIAADVLSGNIPDPTGGATHYWAPKGMVAMGYNETPYWADSERTRWGEVEIGDHVFLARQPVPPGGIASPPIPADISASLQSRRNASDIGEGTTASELARFGQPGAAPVSMSDELATGSGRLRNVPTPRPRPPTPPRATPIADAANVQPITFSSPLESARAKLTAARQNGVTGSPIANVATPNIDMARLSAETGRDIGRDGVVFDRTYDAGNRMSTGGLGALLDSRSFSPSTPNPQPLSPATGPSNRGRPAAASTSVSTPTGPTARGRPLTARAPAPTGPANRGAPTRSTSSTTPSGPSGRGRPVLSSSPTNAPSPLQKTAGTQTGSTFQPAVAGTVQMPRDARPSAVPKYIPKTVMVAVKNDPSAIPAGTKLNFGSRDSVAQRAAGEAAAQKFVPKTIMVLNPEYKAPTPAVQSPALTVSRSNSALAPTPANQSAALRAQRSTSSSPSKPSTTTERKSASPYSSSDPRSQMVSKGTGQTGLHLGIGGW